MNLEHKVFSTAIDGARKGILSAGVHFDDPSPTRAATPDGSESPQRSRLLAMIGHDLKQPLQLISFILELIGTTTIDPQQQPRLRLAQDAVQRLGDGLDRLVLASKPDHRPPGPTPVTFPISDILLRLQPTWREHALRSGVRLRVASCAALVTSDVEMLSTIIGNLVGNAIKYAPRGHVLVGCRRIHDHLHIQVIDTGPGIAAERIDALFVPFHQEDPSSAGFGLGLSIVQRTAAKLDHPLEVRSVVGKGSLFSIQVPLAIGTSACSCHSMVGAAAKAFA